MIKFYLYFLLSLAVVAEPTVFFGTNDMGVVEFAVGAGERLQLTRVGMRSSTMEENPVNFSAGHLIETPSFWSFLTKTEHRDRFTLPEDANLLWSEEEVVATAAFAYRQYAIPGVPSSSGLGLGGYDYQIRYEDIPPVPVATNIIRTVVRGPGKTNFFIGVARTLESGGRYLGWLELVRPQADAFAPFSFGRSALDFLPDRAIKAGHQPEFPKVQTDVTGSEIRLSVPTAYRRYLDTWLVMEKADSLDEPVNWEPLYFSGTNSMTLPADAEMRFYRLRLAQ